MCKDKYNTLNFQAKNKEIKKIAENYSFSAIKIS